MFNVMITPHIWLQLSPTTRNNISKAFDMKRSSSPVCITERGVTRIESDGFTVGDLSALNVESMQKFLGFQEVDESADIHALLAMCARKVDGLVAEEAHVEPVTVEEKVVVVEPEPIPEPAVEKKPPGRPKKTV